MEIEGVKLVKREDAFILDIEGTKAVGIRLPVTTAKEITGEASLAPEGGKLGAKYESGTEQRWFVITDKENPLLRNYNHFTLMAAKGLTHASGSAVLTSDVATYGVSAVYGKGKKEGES
jgi:predicted glycoside hydrolase/deacetylase ChbG (UPF0249 family)